MFELIQSGGWMMLPIILCSIIAMAIIGERFWALQRKKIAPIDLVPTIWQLHRDNKLTDAAIVSIKRASPLGRILAAGLVNHKHGREMMKTSIEEVGRQVAHELERYLNTLGTIAVISPLLGLLGTVSGMIKIFAIVKTGGIGDPRVLGDGISEVLMATAAGLIVAIPSLIFHRYFERLVDDRVMKMEEEALRLIDIMHGEREEA